MSTLQEYYQQTSAMTLDTYDRQVILEALNMIDDFIPFTYYQRRQCLTIMLKILSTTVGVFFLGTYKSLCIILLEKVDECMDTIGNSEHELKETIANFIQANADVFSAHGIGFTIYFRDGQRDEMMQSFLSDDEDEEEWQDYHDDYYEPEYEQHYSDDDDDNDDDDDQQLAEINAQDEEYERKEQEKNLQIWKKKMTIVQDHLLRRNDPFYTACINSQIKKNNMVLEQEFERQITALTTILRNELRNSETEDIDEMSVFKVDSNLVENLLECKVVNEMNKIFGCPVYVYYTKNGMGGKCEVFDGTYTHELDTFANVSVIISNLKKEMISECLYNTELVCKDVAGLITTFI